MSLLDRLDVPAARSRASTSATDSPRAAASSAAPTPVTPPPMMSTSKRSRRSLVKVSCAARRRQSTGRKARNRGISSHVVHGSAMPIDIAVPGLFTWHLGQDGPVTAVTDSMPRERQRGQWSRSRPPQHWAVSVRLRHGHHQRRWHRRPACLSSGPDRQGLRHLVGLARLCRRRLVRRPDRRPDRARPDDDHRGDTVHRKCDRIGAGRRPYGIWFCGACSAVWRSGRPASSHRRTSPRSRRPGSADGSARFSNSPS